MGKEWAKKFPAKHAEYVRNYRRVRNYRKEKTQKLKTKIYIHYSGSPPKCACCGENRIIFLSLDHINNDGAKHRKENKITNALELYRWIIKNNFPEIFQILCRNCNWAKSNGGCPHNSED